jgi:hypothetical protein
VQCLLERIQPPNETSFEQAWIGFNELEQA